MTKRLSCNSFMRSMCCSSTAAVFHPNLGKGHVRLVYLADTEVLDVAFDRIERFLEKHRGH